MKDFTLNDPLSFKTATFDRSASSQTWDPDFWIPNPDLLLDLDLNFGHYPISTDSYESHNP